MSHTRSHIVLIGFMGSGKSTIGKLIAQELELPFVDLDEMIERQEDMAISKIFTLKGESYFREVENTLLKAVLFSETKSVVATGGGAPCFLDGMNLINKFGHSIYLKVGRDRLLERINADTTRPLVKGKTKKQLKQFIDMTLRKRENFYLKADKTIMAYDNPKSIVSRIVKQLDLLNL